MAYRIRPDRPFTGELRKAAAGELERAIALITEQPEGLHEAIHQARRKLKRVRALYRLVAEDAKDFQKHENARLRETAHALSLVRDATALIETAAYLEDHALNAEEREALAHARTALTVRRDTMAVGEADLPQKASAAVEACREAIHALDELSFDDRRQATAKRIARGWRSNLARAREAVEACRTDAHEEVFHELRKCAQDYSMHLALLRDLWPSAMVAKLAGAKALVTVLGHEHDLALLVALLDREPDVLNGGAELAHLLGAVIRQQQALRREALEIAEHLFADPPKAEARIIETLWLEAGR